MTEFVGPPDGGPPASGEPDPVAAPPAGPLGFLVVGVGASAGGLAAFEAFFGGMPKDIDLRMAFVLVQHLAPDHKSLLSELIRRCTQMEVVDVEDGMSILPNRVYVMPPAHDMALMNGALQLLEPAEPRGQRLPIDFFFRSLAHDQGARAVGVILSGTGSDGTVGLRSIKDRGGMAMAQRPDSTEFDGMPASALATGVVDFELAAGDMGRQLVAWASRALAGPRRGQGSALPSIDSALRRVLLLLRDKTGHDFSHYKPSTIQRRIERRMAAQRVEDFEAYASLLQRLPAELDTLLCDLLIGVTSFFRDGLAWEALEASVIPGLFEDKPPGSVVRVWTAGCSTGEEAYSVAMLLVEHITQLSLGQTVQLFATDINTEGIATARAGLYSAAAVAGVSPARLARFFSSESDGALYRVHKSLRDLVIFSEHDLTRDPPFSRLDLVTCRNLLIYMDGELQRRIIPVFHYALRPGGALFLGTSEGVGEFEASFPAIDRRAKLYRHREVRPRYSPTVAVGAALVPSAKDASRHVAKTPTLREVTEQALLRQMTPAAVLVDARGDVLFVHGRTGAFLEPAQGEAATANVLEMARDGLRPGLSRALLRATETKSVEQERGLPVMLNGRAVTVDVTVRPVSVPASRSTDQRYLVVLDEVRPAPAPPHDARGIPSPSNDTALREELRSKEQYLDSANERLARSTEELKSSNEELQSVNEELQSANEELETSKEELQSVNEELTTVNTELQVKVADLSRANNDLKNLLAGTGIGTVFVDHQLRILRFTPAASALIHLIPGDVGRPVAHLASNLVGYDSLLLDARAVLDTLIPKEVAVQTIDGKWYTMRIQPYRTLENVIEGAVISFVDITATKEAQQRLAADERRFHDIMSSATDDIVVVDERGTIVFLNHAATQPDPRRAIGARWIDWITPEDRDVATRAIAGVFSSSDATTIEVRPSAAARPDILWQVELSRLPSSAEVVLVVRDISDRRRQEASLKQARDLARLAIVARDARDAMTVQALDGRTLAWNGGATRLYGWTETEALAMNARERVPASLREQALELLERLTRTQTIEPARTQRTTKSGAVVDVTIVSTALLDTEGQPYAVATTERLLSDGP